MSMVQKVMAKFYREAAGDPSKLPWHREDPDNTLASAVRACAPGSRALDVGCGAGVFSVWMADQGLQVTGIDLFPEATAMAQKLAAGKPGRKLEFVTGDLFTYAPGQPFDRVCDSGCLHSLVGGSVPAYKQQLLSWLAPRGTYVLEHWGKRNAFDWRPIGPRRRSETAIQGIFAPELRAEESHSEDFQAPFPFGPWVRGVSYRMTRAV